jgi:hypothetical protein
MFFPLVQDEFRLPLFDAEELVDMRMHLVTNVFARPQAHHNELRVRSGEQHLSKIRVLRGLFFDRPNVSSHSFGLLQVPDGIASFRLGSAPFCVYSFFHVLGDEFPVRRKTGKTGTVTNYPVLEWSAPQN